MYGLDPTAVTLMLFTAVLSGFVSAIPFKNKSYLEHTENLQARIIELEDEVKEKNKKVAEIRAKLVELLEFVDENYDDMPPLEEL